MNARSSTSLALLLVIPGLVRAQMTLGESTQVVFATIEEGRQVLSRRDDFVERMSPFDRAARLKTDKDVSEREYLEFVANNVLAWDDSEKQKIRSAFQRIQAELDALSLPLPEKVYLIKTTGREEGGAAYTRAHAIVLPEHALAAPVMNLPKSLCHEIFHILSRANPDLREKLYAEIGFVKCNEVPFPKELNPRKITNPDAPKNDHCIRVQVQGKDHWGVPILFSSAAKYDREQGGEFFNYLQFQLLLVERDEAVGTVKPIYDHQEARLVGMNEVSGFFEQIGKNTGYIIHPEEVLADNFALLAMRQRQVPSPSVLEKMEAVLKGNRKTKSGAPEEAGKPGP